MDLLDHLRAAGFEADLVHIPSGVNGIYGGSYFRARRPSIAAPAGSSPEAVRP
jgi:hypothetical protein